MRRVYRARGWPARSILHVASGDVGSREVTTIEAIGQKESGRRIQQAWLELEVVQCGYCQSGQIMGAAALIERNLLLMMPKSMQRWPETSAVARPTRAYALLSNWPPANDRATVDFPSPADRRRPHGCLRLR
jgi:hypothetical protein